MRFNVKKIIILLFLFIAIALVCNFSVAQTSIKPGLYDHKINFENQQREYKVYIPASVNFSKPIPLILCFHGGGGNANSQIKMTGMNKSADKHGFIVAYPDGTPSFMVENMKTWNSNNDCCGRANRINSNDVGFVRAIIAELKQKLYIDPDRIYATGMSNGGMMSYRLACELSDQIAAIAPVAGTLNITPCKPQRPCTCYSFSWQKRSNV